MELLCFASFVVDRLDLDGSPHWGFSMRSLVVSIVVVETLLIASLATHIVYHLLCIVSFPILLKSLAFINISNKIDGILRSMQKLV